MPCSDYHGCLAKAKGGGAGLKAGVDDSHMVSFRLVGGKPNDDLNGSFCEMES